MKVIDAYWEKRNLGIDVMEFIVGKNDSPESIVEILENINCDYAVVKLPVGRFDISIELSKMGYVFVEAMNHLIHDMQPIILSEDKIKTAQRMELKPASSDDLNYILKRIKEGMFRTDRISLDPAFSMEQSANRYVGWICDEVERKSEFFKVVYGDHNVGFIGISKSGEKGYHDFLNGIYTEFWGKGYATCMTYLIVEELKKRGAEFISTDISSNNIASLQARMKCGFLISETTYIYVKNYGEV